MNLEQLVNQELERLHQLLKSAANTDTQWTFDMIKAYNAQLLVLLGAKK